jgi:Tfp pilus assembly protein PilF
VALPLVAWVIDRWAIRRPMRDSLRALAPWAILVPVWVAVTFLVRHNEGVAPHPSFLARFVVAGNAIDFYFLKLLWPAGLTIDYGRTPAHVLAQPSSYVLWLIPIAIAAVVWRFRERQPMLVAAYGVFLTALLPVMGFIPNTFQIYSTESDRYLYLPMLGIAMLVAWVVEKAIDRKVVIPVVAVSIVILAVWSVVSTKHVEDYRDGLHLYPEVLAVNPSSWMAHNNLGLEYAQVRRYDDAIAQTTQAIARMPAEPKFICNLADQYMESQLYPSAADEYSQALKLAPDMPGVEKAYGYALYKAGRYDDAATALRDAVARDPHDLDGYDKLGAALVDEHKLDAATAVWHNALAIDPNDVNGHYNLGAVLVMQSRFDDGIAELNEALRLKPDYAMAQTTLNQAQQLKAAAGAAAIRR